MDGIDTLQSSASETKAERIARYKAERRRELAERYGNTEDFTSKYVRRDRKIGETSETVSSVTKEKDKHEDNGSEPSYTRQGIRSKASKSVETVGGEAIQATQGNSHFKSDSITSENASSVKMSSHFR